MQDHVNDRLSWLQKCRDNICTLTIRSDRSILMIVSIIATWGTYFSLAGHLTANIVDVDGYVLRSWVLLWLIIHVEAGIFGIGVC